MSIGDMIFWAAMSALIIAIIWLKVKDCLERARLDWENIGRTTRIAKRYMNDGSIAYFCQWFNHTHGSDLGFNQYGWNTFGKGDFLYGHEPQPKAGFPNVQQAENWYKAYVHKKLIWEIAEGKPDETAKEPI